MREVIANIIIVSLGTAFLWFLGCIWVYGSHFIQEPNFLYYFDWQPDVVQGVLIK